MSQRSMLKTAGGHSLDEAISAVQKCCRRGDVEQAMYWATEVETKFHKYLWRRLRVIAAEDIGVADMTTVLFVAEMAAQYEYMRAEDRSGSERLMLANAILALCMAPKTRASDDLQCVVYQRKAQAGWRLETPDVALDKHTERGRSVLGRRGLAGWTHFHEEGSKLVNEMPGLNVWRAESEQLHLTLKDVARPSQQMKMELDESDETPAVQDQLPF